MLRRMMGSGMDRMPNWAFRMMAAMFAVRDRLTSVGRLLDDFGLQPGQVVVDYGCGPGSYIGRASELVGAAGRVYAVDIHDLAIQAIEKKAARESLANVTGLVAPGGRCPLEDGAADLIYALDMFHMVSDPNGFLGELRRIIKGDGVLFISDGHQPRGRSRQKILDSGAWEITTETPKWMQCRPVEAREENS